MSKETVSTSDGISLFLFSKDRKLIEQSLAGGIAGIVIDWENKGKRDRQEGFDTQINADTIEDLRYVRSITDALILCRINCVDESGFYEKEIHLAVENGADEILVPMVRSVTEVESILAYTEQYPDLGVGILIETVEAVRLAHELGQLPLKRVYVGLNDLAINRGVSNIFESLPDGTVDDVREHISCLFGVAGLTLPECGNPIPCRLIMSEIARLRCDFTFLRRSFLEDVQGKKPSVEVQRILAAFSQQIERSIQQAEDDRESFRRIVYQAPEVFGIGKPGKS